MPRAAIDQLPAEMGDALELVVPEIPAQLHLDEATRGGRIRPVWANGFANSTNGFSGSDDITIAIVDGGVDDSQTDLAWRLEYGKDYTADNDPAPIDFSQHSTHVAGMTFGIGAVFGCGPGMLYDIL